MSWWDRPHACPASVFFRVLRDVHFPFILGLIRPRVTHRFFHSVFFFELGAFHG